MLASPVSDDIFLFIAAEAASEAESAATGETTDVAPGGEAAPLPAAAAFLNSYFYRFLFLGPSPGSPGANDQPGTVSQLWGPSASRCNRGVSTK